MSAMQFLRATTAHTLGWTSVLLKGGSAALGLTASGLSQATSALKHLGQQVAPDEETAQEVGTEGQAAEQAIHAIEALLKQVDPSQVLQTVREHVDLGNLLGTEQAQDTAQQATEQAQDTAQQATDQAQDTAQQATDQAQDTAQQATDQARKQVQDPAKQATEVVEKAVDRGEGEQESGEDQGGDGQEADQESGGGLKQRLRELSNRELVELYAHESETQSRQRVLEAIEAVANERRTSVS